MYECMYIYIYMYVHTNICMQTFVYAGNITYSTLEFIHVHIHTYIHSYMSTLYITCAIMYVHLHISYFLVCMWEHFIICICSICYVCMHVYTENHSTAAAAATYKYDHIHT